MSCIFLLFLHCIFIWLVHVSVKLFWLFYFRIFQILYITNFIWNIVLIHEFHSPPNFKTIHYNFWKINGKIAWVFHANYVLILSTNRHIFTISLGFDEGMELHALPKCIFRPSLTLTAYLECHIFLLDWRMFAYALEWDVYCLEYWFLHLVTHR